MYTKGDLIEEFRNECVYIEAQLEKIILNSTPNDEDSILVTALVNGIPDISLWWDPANFSDYMEQNRHLRQNYPDFYNEMLDNGAAQLKKNSQHYKEFEEAVTSEEDENSSFETALKFLPHPLGADGCVYGKALRDTDEYKALFFACTAAGLSCKIQFSTDPEAKSLRAAFNLYIEISTDDDTPLKTRIAAAKASGAFTPSKGMH